MFTPNVAKELLFTIVFFYICANFGENPSRNASVRVHGQRQTSFIICPMLLCYSYGTDNYRNT